MDLRLRQSGDGTDTRRAATPVLVAVAIGMGALVSVQSRVSAALARETDVYNSAWVTAMTGTVILVVILLVSPAARRGFGGVRAALRSRSLPRWALLGGLGGMFFVVAQGTAASVLGLALFSMSVVAGQVVGGLVFDFLGAAGGGRRRPTVLRVLGSVLAIAAVSWGALGGGDGHIDVLLLVMAFAAGVGLAGAAGLTGRVQGASGSVVTTAMTNHLLGLTVIVLIVLVLLPTGASGFRLPAEPVLYLGGVIGPIGVALGAILVRRLGVLLMGLGMVAGQLIGSLVLELIVPTSRDGVQAASLGGIALTLVAVAITTLDGRSQRTDRDEEPHQAPADRAVTGPRSESASA